MLSDVRGARRRQRGMKRADAEITKADWLFKTNPYRLLSKLAETGPYSFPLWSTPHSVDNHYSIGFEATECMTRSFISDIFRVLVRGINIALSHTTRKMAEIEC